MLGLKDLETGRKNLNLDYARKCVKNKNESYLLKTTTKNTN